MAVRKKPRQRPAKPAPRKQTTGLKPAPSAPAEAAGRAQCAVVGVGASAGGLEAFSELLHRLPPGPGFALVFVQHLDPKHSSMLTELLGRATAMPVEQVRDGAAVLPNHVYVIPPNANMRISGGLLRLDPRSTSGQHMPVDWFFRSLAADQGSKAIGVILSGTASDGTLGLKAIKEYGGITFAQDVHTAKYDGMPRSAMAAGCVDFVLPPDEIARELVRLAKHTYMNGVREAHPGGHPDDESAFEEVFGLLRGSTGVDFASYKPGTIRRRTLRRMALHKMDSVQQYARLLKENRPELQLLFQDLLINVTAFFREPATFEALKAHTFPVILKDCLPEEAIRVWVPGCATGEEAYSIAICLLEYLRAGNLEARIQIFGTDLSEQALEKARTGIYPESIAAEVSPERLRRFFVRVNSSYQITRAVRECCIFARQNVTKDPPFSKLDLILCRNVLIYLGPRLQTTVMRLFHYALKPGAFLALGPSESVGNADDLFAPQDKKAKIYARRPVSGYAATNVGGYQESRPRSEPKIPVETAGPYDAQRKVDQLLLAKYVPPAVLVDSSLKILQFRGQSSPFVEHTAGEANLDLPKMTPAAVGLEVRKLVRRAETRNAAVKGKGIPISIKKRIANVSVSVTPVHLPGVPEPRFLVVFEEDHAPAAAEKGRGGRKPAGAEARRVRDLELELNATQKYLQAVIEEQEAASEELKSAHEEVQSSNEELQSTNEELLTAKEELQSTNEELTTVNEEMQSRNFELQHLNNDLLNLISSVNIPIVMLGNDLRIRRFTPQAERILSLLATDVGRPISDFRLKVSMPDLVEVCEDVMDNLAPREREVQDADGRIYSLWVRPYRTAENRIDGVVLAMLEITERKQSAEARYRRLFEASRDCIAIADAFTGEIVDINPSVTRLFGWQRGQLIGVRFWESPLFRGSSLDHSLMDDLSETESVQRLISLPSESGELVATEVICNRYTEGDRRVIQFNIRDVSARKQIEEQLRREDEQSRQAQKMDAVGRLAGGVAHDFNNLLTAILGYSDLLDQELPEGDARALLAQIRGAGERASILTRQLLAFGRKQATQPAVLNPNEVVNEMRQLFQVMLSKNIRIKLNLAPEVGQVKADRGQIEQVLLNLILNARDAMPGAGEIVLETANVDIDEAFAREHPSVTAGAYVMVAVKDTGSGMSDETQTHLFEPFFTTKEKGKGVGLGLSTTYSIVTQNGGYIRAYSEVGVGSTFTIYLPRLTKGAQIERPAEPVGEPAGGTETILLVEDDTAIRILTRRVLGQLGYHVLESVDGPEALRVSRQYAGPIHLLLTDVVMRDMSGREVEFQIGPKRPEMRVLYMTGHTEDAISQYGVLDGNSHLLKKPFTRHQLAAKVRETLDGAAGKQASSV